MAIRLFEFNDNKISLVRPEIGLYKEFSTILRRDRGTAKDSDGRKKYRAMREFHYIYLMADYDSSLLDKGLTGKELKEEAKSEAELPDNWKEDEFIRAAITKYKALNFDSSKELILELLILFRGNIKRVIRLREGVDRLLENPMLSRSEMESIAQLQEKIFDIAAGTPGKIKALTQALKDTKELNLGDIEELRGGGPIPESALPETAKS